VEKSLPGVKIVVRCDDRGVARTVAWAVQEALQKKYGFTQVSGFGAPVCNMVSDHPIVVTHEENK
jgi:hypothetical protein